MNQKQLKKLYGLYRRYIKFTQAQWSAENEAVSFFINQEIERIQDNLFSDGRYGGYYWILSKMRDESVLTRDRYIGARWVMRQAIKLGWNETKAGWEHYLMVKATFTRNQSRLRAYWIDEIPF